jgi:hypothetical protein
MVADSNDVSTGYNKWEPGSLLVRELGIKFSF